MQHLFRLSKIHVERVADNFIIIIIEHIVNCELCDQTSLRRVVCEFELYATRICSCTTLSFLVIIIALEFICVDGHADRIRAALGHRTEKVIFVFCAKRWAETTCKCATKSNLTKRRRLSLESDNNTTRKWVVLNDSTWIMIKLTRIVFCDRCCVGKLQMLMLLAGSFTKYAVACIPFHISNGFLSIFFLFIWKRLYRHRHSIISMASLAHDAKAIRKRKT